VTRDPQTPFEQSPSTSVGTRQPSAGGTGNPASTLELPRQAVDPAELWLRRLAVLVFVILCGVMGVLLVILPWSLQWTDNHLLWGYPALRSFLANAFVRGLSSGLGILDLWIGFREASHYHEGSVEAK
jgi:hypothetical protein